MGVSHWDSPGPGAGLDRLLPVGTKKKLIVFETCTLVNQRQEQALKLTLETDFAIVAQYVFWSSLMKAPLS